MMEWPSSSLDLNLNKNLSSIVKMRLYECGKQCNSKTDLWEAIKTTVLKIEPVEVKKKKLKKING